LRNLGTPGNIAFSLPKSFAVGNSPICISAGDLNGDGKPDMVVSNQLSNNVSVLRNTGTTGNISFDTHIDYIVDKNPFSIAIADLDEDQKPDIISANSDVFTISILKNITNVVTGVINVGNEQYIKIYPNPVKNDLCLYWQIQNTTSLNIILSDQQGRQVLAKQNVHNAEAIELNKFPAGIYFLKILTRDQRINYTTKIIKQ